jgi:hypothetical protein
MTRYLIRSLRNDVIKSARMYNLNVDLETTTWGCKVYPLTENHITITRRSKVKARNVAKLTEDLSSEG